MKIMKKMNWSALLLIEGLILVFLSQSVFSEVKTSFAVDRYWKGLSENKELVKRHLHGRTVENGIFEVRNISFNRNHHAYGRGDILSVTFDIFNKVDEPFEGYVFVVADVEKRFKKYGDFYVLISHVSPDPTGKTKDFHISSGIIPEYARQIASSKDNSKLIGVLTKEELMNSKADDPSKGIPVRISNQTQIDVKHYMPYGRGEKFFNHVLILIYSKKKEKMISYELQDDPKRVGKKRLVHYKKTGDKKSEYVVKEQYPLLFAKRYKLFKK